MSLPAYSSYKARSSRLRKQHDGSSVATVSSRTCNASVVEKAHTSMKGGAFGDASQQLRAVTGRLVNLNPRTAACTLYANRFIAERGVHKVAKAFTAEAAVASQFIRALHVPLAEIAGCLEALRKVWFVVSQLVHVWDLRVEHLEHAVVVG